MAKQINGIQQVGIGIPNMHEAWKWYRKNFGTDIRVFEEAAPAALMIRYTGGEVHKRHAALAVNMQGGGGFEIWQYTSRTPQLPNFEVLYGDLGIFAAKMRAVDVNALFKQHQENKIEILTQITKDPSGKRHYFVRDPYQNIFEVVEDKYCFKNENKASGGVLGAIVCVSDIEKSLKLYRDILGYDQILHDTLDVSPSDLVGIKGATGKIRRVLLTHSKEKTGGFSKLLGPTQIELVQVFERAPRNIFENRFWGDRGFIHLCFDINDMKDLQKECESKGFPFTVDSSNSFDMGEAAGHFSYIEDPDGTWIEFVETHKVPILKKIGWYLDLRKRDPKKNLPDWIVKAMAFNRVKD